MKNYNIIVKANANEQGTFSKDKIKSFLKSNLGYNFRNVQGSINKFWITGQYIENKFCEFISGPKYYQLAINDRDFGISASGDFNAFSMAGIIKQAMYKKAMEAK